MNPAAITGIMSMAMSMLNSAQNLKAGNEQINQAKQLAAKAKRPAALSDKEKAALLMSSMQMLGDLPGYSKIKESIEGETSNLVENVKRLGGDPSSKFQVVAEGHQKGLDALAELYVKNAAFKDQKTEQHISRLGRAGEKETAHATELFEDTARSAGALDYAGKMNVAQSRGDMLNALSSTVTSLGTTLGSGGMTPAVPKQDQLDVAADVAASTKTDSPIMPDKYVYTPHSVPPAEQPATIGPEDDFAFESLKKQYPHVPEQQLMELFKQIKSMSQVGNYPKSPVFR